MADDNNSNKSPFDLLLETIDATVDLSKLRQEEHRNTTRTPYSGVALLTSPNRNISTTAVMRNVSPTGVGFEVNNIPIKVGDVLVIDFAGAGSAIKNIQGKIQWIAPIEAKKNLLVGLAFENLTIENKEKIKEFFEYLQAEAYKFV
jgi:hypothetical protein